MRAILLTSLVLSLVSSDVLAQRDGQRDGERGGERGGRRGPRTQASAAELVHFRHERVEIESASMVGESAEFALFLPADYADEKNAERSYPLVLWLHGMNEDSGRFLREGGAAVLDKLRAEGKVPDLILAAPSAPRRTVYENGEAAGDVEKMILDDIVGHLEKTYRISKARGDRAIMGVSIGGLGALKIALRYPAKFGTVAVHSSAMFPADPTKLDDRALQRVQRTAQSMGFDDLLGDPIDPEKWAKVIPSAMAKAMKPEDFKGLRIYFDAGTDDRYGFAPPNQDFSAQLKAQGIEHVFELIEGGGHAWGTGSTQKALVNSLQFVAAGFSGAKAAPAAADKGKEGAPAPAASGGKVEAGAGR